MTLDEALLETTKTEVYNKLIGCNNERTLLRTIYEKINEISLIDVTDDKGRVIKELPLDPKLEVPITQDRRDAIFVKIQANIEKLNDEETKNQL